jgi:hypothetical protein
MYTIPQSSPVSTLKYALIGLLIVVSLAGSNDALRGQDRTPQTQPALQDQPARQNQRDPQAQPATQPTDSSSPRDGPTSELKADAHPSPYQAVQCEGFYPGHLQGIAIDGQGAIFWSFTTVLAKTDALGKILHKVDVVSHHGDLTYVDGHLYVAVNLGDFNNPRGKADNWIYVYRASDLKRLAKHEIQQVKHGAGGIAFHKGSFLVVGGLPPDVQENYVYEYDGKFQFQGHREIASGYTLLGIQAAEHADGRWWFGCYGRPEQLLVTDNKFNMQGRYEFSCSLGIVHLEENRFLVASGSRVVDKGHTGRLQIAETDPKRGLVIRAK